MPELPDVTVYIEALERRILGATLERIQLLTPFVLRSVEPSVTAVSGLVVRNLRRLRKRIVIGVDGDLFLVNHLMVAGRLHWNAPGAEAPRQIGLAHVEF